MEANVKSQQLHAVYKQGPTWCADFCRFEDDHVQNPEYPCEN